MAEIFARGATVDRKGPGAATAQEPAVKEQNTTVCAQNGVVAHREGGAGQSAKCLLAPSCESAGPRGVVYPTYVYNLARGMNSTIFQQNR